MRVFTPKTTVPWLKVFSLYTNLFFKFWSSMGAAHSKCWLKYAFSHFLREKHETQMLVKIYNSWMNYQRRCEWNALFCKLNSYLDKSWLNVRKNDKVCLFSLCFVNAAKHVSVTMAARLSFCSKLNRKWIAVKLAQ